MSFLSKQKVVTALLAGSLLLPATTALGNDWTKPHSRTRGAVIGGAAGAVLGPPGVVAGAAIGNGIQRLRQTHHAAHHRRHHRR